jgi:PPM family protein phosphatase
MPEMTLSTGAATDTGRLRELNEDRYWVDADRGIFLVVDGVGGEAAGDLAAQTAVESIQQAIGEPLPPEARVRHAIVTANNRIFKLAQEHPEWEGMACVLTLALVEDGWITIGHVGDSRFYMIRSGSIRKLTSDHSPAGECEDRGELSEEEAMLHPRRHEVFREVGGRLRDAHEKEFIEIRRCPFRPDAAILLCSDGLTDQVTSGEIAGITGRYTGDCEQIARELVNAANRAGGKDNVTALFVAGPEFRGSEGSPVHATRPRFAATRGPTRKPLLAGRGQFVIYGLLIGMLLWAVLRTRG